MTNARDIVGCTKCGKLEHIHLLDGAPPAGVVDREGADFTELHCVACYDPPESWAPCAVEHIALSVRPDLKPLYDAWLRDNEE
jgi:hypothetical protein